MKSLKTIITQHQHKRSLIKEQKEALDKFSKIELLMLCDRFMDETEVHRSVDDILGIEEMSRIFASQYIQSFHLDVNRQKVLSIEEILSFEEVVILNASSFTQEVAEAVEQLEDTSSIAKELSDSISENSQSDEAPPFELEKQDEVAKRDFETLILQLFSNHGFILKDFKSEMNDEKAHYEFNLLVTTPDEEKALWSAIKVLKETHSQDIEVVHKAKKSDKTKRKINVEFTFAESQLTVMKRNEVVI